MKNSLQLLALGLVLFLGACSVSPDAFLESVKGKTMYSAATMLPANEMGTVSADGKTFIGLKFVEMVDATTGSYTMSGKNGDDTISHTRSIHTTDGKTGTLTHTAYTLNGEDKMDLIPAADRTVKFWLQVAPK